MIQGVWVNISTQIISQFLQRANFELSVDTLFINHCINEMIKGKIKKTSTDDKYFYLKWIRGIIFTM